MSFLALIVGYLICAVIGFLALAVLWDIFTGKIDLRLLISEKTGEASMSRFQLLIFTFVVSLSFFLVVASNTKSGLPPVPSGVLALLGISASSYTVSKAIQPSLTKGGGAADGNGNDGNKGTSHAAQEN